MDDGERQRAQGLVDDALGIPRRRPARRVPGLDAFIALIAFGDVGILGTTWILASVFRDHWAVVAAAFPLGFIAQLAFGAFLTWTNALLGKRSHAALCAVVSVAVASVRVGDYDYGGQAQPPTATAVTPVSASAAWAAASRASGTRYGEQDT